MFVGLTHVSCTGSRNIVGATFDISETPVSATINGWLVSLLVNELSAISVHHLRAASMTTLHLRLTRRAFLSARIRRGKDLRGRISERLDVVICEPTVKAFFSAAVEEFRRS